jgi:hypothetical protein
MSSSIFPIFLVGSVVYPSRILKFSPEERFIQTVETMKNIRDKLPNVFILLIEGSVISQNMELEFKRHADHVIYLGNDREINSYVYSPNFGIGEMKLLQRGVEYLQNEASLSLENSLVFRNPQSGPKGRHSVVFKISGRYKLDETFNLSSFPTDKYTFVKEVYVEIPEVYMTGLYSIPFSEIVNDNFKNILTDGISLLKIGDKSSIPDFVGHLPVEKILFDLIPKNKVNLVEKIGVTGQLS